MGQITREDALALLHKYNKNPFHLQHAYTVEAVMKWFAKELGYGESEEYWELDELLSKTLEAMAATEDEVAKEIFI